ncbi:hypothetical protein [Virgibacillus alimentarius]|uniref:Transporter n=1 Tax=Virgibacillus alimentarius TaxID=698769 RepID=A0ABS4S6Y5_9BACI|nr:MULTISPECIES: hypothetical protein [Virgibacillus]MBP2257169.1 hypothetical protein [Virgibacillus alimentarius]HLR69397.1 hypothetical protein [Virgibacillus sp.]
MHNDFGNNRQFNPPGYLLGQIFGGGQHSVNSTGYYPPFTGSPDGEYPGFQGGGGPPTTPPPNFTPTKQQIQPFAIDPGAIQGCLFRFTYIWLSREAFWFFPIFVGRNSISGFRWSHNRWTYFGIDLNSIQSFQCF